MNAPGTRRWASSPVDTRRHLLPVDDGPRPIGCLVAVCGHVMPASALTGAEPATAATVCGTCEAMAAVEAARSGREIVLRGGGRPAERLRLLDEPAQHGLGPLVDGSGPASWGDRAGRHERG